MEQEHSFTIFTTNPIFTSLKNKEKKKIKKANSKFLAEW